MTIIPISSLNHYQYCRRRCALIHIECIFVENEYTIEGDQAHEHVDKAGFELRAGWLLLRALPLFSEKLGLTGKADLVEVQKQGKEIIAARPVDYKRGKKRKNKWYNDAIQLCAQALCLEEMFGLSVAAGLIFHVKSQSRSEIIFDNQLRKKTRETIEAVRDLFEKGIIPKAELKPQCEGCSLHEVCVPELDDKNINRASHQLLKT